MSMWESISEYTSGFECDRCNNTEKTKMGHIRIADAFFIMTMRWILCLSCHEAGWRPPAVLKIGDKKITYFNINNNKKHYYTLPGPIPNPIKKKSPPPAATDTFKLSFRPYMGICTTSSQYFKIFV